MKKIKQIKKYLIYVIVGLLILLSGISYAYFNGRVTGVENNTTIAANAGIMQIYYNGGAAIAVNSFSPSATAFVTKNFTVTGNNNTNQKMYYNIKLVMESNTFSYDALKYKLTSTNTGGNGTIAPSITTMQEIGTGAREIFLGNGTFVGPTSGEKVHTYSLALYFPVTGGDQSHDQSKLFEAYIKIEKGIGATNEYLSDSIINQYGGSTNITAAPAGTFENINGSTDNLMYKVLDNYGMSYYYRGAKNYINNNLIFGGFQWKIVRINGDGSLRLIYNGTCPNNICTINTTGTATQIGTYAYNTSSNDNKYIGYMFSPSSTTASTSRAQAVTNVTNGNMKTTLDNWYSTNISGTDYEDYISDTLFCNDRRLRSEVGGSATGSGYSTSTTYYAAYQRLLTTKVPDIRCDQNDRFTVNEIIYGNDDLIYPVGLLTADEAAITGLVYNTTNSTNFLYTNQNWWTMSPSYLSSTARMWGVGSTGTLSQAYLVTTPYGVRPVINLKANTKGVGNGSISNPYRVQDETSLGNRIIAEYGGKNNIIAAPAGTFDNSNGSTDNLMYKMADDYGDSYYFRGAKDYINNNLIFANFQWKIVRINGDESIRIIYNGTCPSNSCTINSTGAATNMGSSVFNTTDGDAKFVGYMYSPSETTASTSRAQATTNTYDSAIKTYLDNWYSTNLSSYNANISDTLFCNDRQLRSEVGGTATGTGYGTSNTYYAAYYRLDTTKTPNIKCGLKNDRFTVSDTTIGNGALTYPIGLLTPDELALAGFKAYTANNTNYLYNNQTWWTIGPRVFSDSYHAGPWRMDLTGSFHGHQALLLNGVRGVINLKRNVTFTGTGTTSDPYKVV
ncbi:MAG: hypothetical protein PHY33_07615 [Methanobacteriaceae archaeon]|nr:hypothetical protein [Methanobacteriaceae archaeon]